jgi:hypothetical protein
MGSLTDLFDYRGEGSLTPNIAHCNANPHRAPLSDQLVYDKRSGPPLRLTDNTEGHPV